MVYCTPLATKWFSQVTYKQLDFDTEGDYEGFIQNVLIPAAEKVIDSYCHHDFNNNVGGTVTLDGNGKQKLVIPPPYVPVISVSSVTVDGTDVTSDIKSYSTYIAYDGGSFTEDYQNVVVVLNYGYASVPTDVELACAEYVANMLLELVRRKMIPDLIAQDLTREGGGATSLFRSSKVFTKEIKETLNKYVYSSVGVT